MLGTYYNFISTDEEAFSLGGTVFYMGYDKNVNEVIIGHGKYYSPQNYTSFSVPVSYYRRHSFDWTYGVRGTVSFSNASFDAPYNIPGTSPSTSQGSVLVCSFILNIGSAIIGVLSVMYHSNLRVIISQASLTFISNITLIRTGAKHDFNRIH